MKPDYEREGVRLYLGDCRDVLPHLSGVDAVVTDPPYGINLHSNGQHFVRNDIQVTGDDSLEVANAVRMWCEDNKIPLSMFYSPYVPMTGFRSILVWNKGDAVGAGGDWATCWKRTFELIGVERNRALNGGRDGAVLNFPVNTMWSDFKFHACQKPVDLMRYLIEKLAVTLGVVVDPFMGSGTTGIACIRTGRKFIGIEKEPKYFDIAVQRIEAEFHRAPLFAEQAAQEQSRLFDD